MQKFVLKLFGFFKSCTQFIKILIVFLVLMLILYWIQDLTGGNWAWMSFISPVLDFLLDVGKAVWPGHMMLFAAVFEFKYLVALIVLGGLYALAHFGYIGLTALEDWFNDSCRFVRKIQEDQFNKSMEKKCISEQKKLKRYQIYVEAQVKPKFAHREYNINMDEQNQIMLKYLIDKTNTCPDKFENGYLFTFNSFSDIDDVLDIFVKLFSSTAPLDYIVCVQILSDNTINDKKQMKSLIDLRTLNKITSLADTAFRYSFNDVCRYNVNIAGYFQHDKDTFELHEYVKKD